MNNIKVKGHDGLVRDVDTGAILNTNNSDYSEYVEKRTRMINKNQQFLKQTEEINNIKMEIKELKTLILDLLANK